MFSIFTYVMSCVTHSEPGLPMFRFEQKFWQINRFHEKRQESVDLHTPIHHLLRKKGRCKSQTRSTWTARLGRIDWDHEKKTKLNEIGTFTHLKVQIPVKTGPI